jgi:excisionase family DNA binding protein
MKLLAPGEIAVILGVHSETVRRWIRSGKVPAIKATARTIRVRSDVLEAFLLQENKKRIEPYPAIKHQ